jgi:uncharacterized membrane protein
VVAIFLLLTLIPLLLPNAFFLSGLPLEVEEEAEEEAEEAAAEFLLVFLAVILAMTLVLLCLSALPLTS